ncbi:MAG: hypothetical protein LBL74_01150 [Bacteroidales bacterium]|jgi:predicted Zn-dependent protease|nr:hypothetical protein [Bacteroidales bacterium]
MDEYFDNDFDDSNEYAQSLAEEFKHLVDSNQPVFFSADEFIEIIEYLYEDCDGDIACGYIDTACEIAIKLYPDNIEIVLYKIRSLFDGVNVDDDMINIALTYAEPFGKDAAYIYKELANNMLEEENNEAALNFFRLALIKNNNDEDSLENFVVTASNLRSKEKECIDFLEALTKSNPYSSYLWFSLSLLSLLYGRCENALKYIECSLALDKDNIEANRCKAETLLSLGKLNEGLSLLHQILEREPDNSQILYSLGGGYDQKEDWENAIYYYKKAFSYDNTNHSALMSIGLCYFSLNDFNTASLYTNKAMKAEPDNIYFKLSCASMLYEAGYKQEAEQLYSDTYANFEEKDICAINWAMTLATDNRLNDAINILDSTIKTCKIEEPNIYYTLLELIANEERYQELIGTYLHLLMMNFNISAEDLAASCPTLMKAKEYKTLITHYINEKN